MSSANCSAGGVFKDFKKIEEGKESVMKLFKMPLKAIFHLFIKKKIARTLVYSV